MKLTQAFLVGAVGLLACVGAGATDIEDTIPPELKAQYEKQKLDIGFQQNNVSCERFQRLTFGECVGRQFKKKGLITTGRYFMTPQQYEILRSHDNKHYRNGFLYCLEFNAGDGKNRNCEKEAEAKQKSYERTEQLTRSPW